MLTNQARQTVTYHCLNSVAVYDAKARNMDNAMRLITTTEAELTADGKSTFRYNVIKDGCQVRSFAFFRKAMSPAWCREGLMKGKLEKGRVQKGKLTRKVEP